MSNEFPPSYRLDLEALPEIQGEGSELIFLAHVLNSGPVVGRHISVLLFAPADLLRYPQGARGIETLGGWYDDELVWEYEGVAYSAVRGTCKRVLYPLESDAVTFEKVVSFANTQAPARRFTVQLKLFDQAGLALTSVFHVAMPHGQTALAKEIRPSNREAVPIITSSDFLREKR